MGVTITHLVAEIDEHGEGPQHAHWKDQCFSGPCSVFNQLRTAIGKAAGYEIDKLAPGASDIARQYFVPLPITPEPTTEQAMGEWPVAPGDPLLILFMHSDCEGIIAWKQIATLAHSITAVVNKIDDDEMRGLAKQFVAGLWTAFVRQKNIQFI